MDISISPTSPGPSPPVGDRNEIDLSSSIQWQWHKVDVVLCKVVSHLFHSFVLFDVYFYFLSKCKSSSCHCLRSYYANQWKGVEEQGGKGRIIHAFKLSSTFSSAAPLERAAATPLDVYLLLLFNSSSGAFLLLLSILFQFHWLGLLFLRSYSVGHDDDTTWRSFFFFSKFLFCVGNFAIADCGPITRVLSTI